MILKVYMDDHSLIDIELPPETILIPPTENCWLIHDSAKSVTWAFNWSKVVKAQLIG